jgi:hypothetical protein
LHYCGGQLEKVSYIIKNNSSCCDDSEGEEPIDDDCCKNENLILKNNSPFTLQQNIDFCFSKSLCNILFITLPFLNSPSTFCHSIKLPVIEAPPPQLLASLVISTSVIRI